MDRGSNIISSEEIEKIVAERDTIGKNITSDPFSLALKGMDATLCNQIKYLQRAKSKLPSYYNARCIIPSLSYEQSSSEATAAAKNFGEGELCIDLTCGLGVDSLHLSRNFKRVTTTERDPLLCRVAKLNFKSLGAENIEVINSNAEDFLKNCNLTDVDLIYIDPARRDQTKKVFLLEDCSPDMNSIMPLATKIAKKIAVKLSPMFDVDAAYHFFSHFGSCTIETVSLRGECKEVIAIIDTKSNDSDKKMNVVVVKGVESYKKYSFSEGKKRSFSANEGEILKYLYIADVAFYKSRCVVELMTEVYGCSDFFMASNNSPVMSNTIIDNFEGESYEVESVYPYKPKELKKLMKKYGSKAKILKKEFPFPSSQIKKELAINDGAEPVVMFTGKSAIFLKKLNNQ